MAGAKETDRDRCHISDFVYYMAFTCTIDHTLKKKETSPQWVYEGGEKVLSKRLNSMTVVTGLFGTPYRILQLKKKKSHVQITPAPIFIIMTHTLIPSSQRRSNRPSLPLKLLGDFGQLVQVLLVEGDELLVLVDTGWRDRLGENR
jgi:hypothetical protein